MHTEDTGNPPSLPHTSCFFFRAENKIQLEIQYQQAVFAFLDDVSIMHMCLKGMMLCQGLSMTFIS